MYVHTRYVKLKNMQRHKIRRRNSPHNTHTYAYLTKYAQFDLLNMYSFKNKQCVLKVISYANTFIFIYFIYA